MFTIILIIVLVILLAVMTGLNFVNVRRCERQYENSKFWYLKYMESEDNYQALEKGRDEESDSYEQQFLTHNEIIEAQSTAIDSYIDDLGFLTSFSMKCIRNCLPTVNPTVADIERVQAIRDQILLQEG